MKHQLSFVLIAFTLGLFACNETDNTNEEAVTGNAKIIVSIFNDGDPLELETRTYTNDAGNEYTVSEFKFYLSNVKLRNTSTGDLFIEPDSYHLVERSPESHVYEIEITNVPLATYNELEFAIGVDNAQNYSLDNIGALDPSNNMAWDWNTGYKFLLLEGRFTTQNQEQAGVVMHIGGDSNYRRLIMPLNQPVTVNSSNSTNFLIDVEVSQIFKDPTTIDFNENNVVMFDAISTKLSANYAKNAFTLRSVEN